MKEIFAWATPLLLIVLAWFLKPVIEGVPAIERKQEVQALQLQQIQTQLAAQQTVNEKNTASLEKLDDRADDLKDQIKDVERAIKK